MVAMAHPEPRQYHLIKALRDGEGEASAAIEELIAELGARAVVAACLRSSAGQHFEKLGGNATLRIAHVILREIVYSKDPQLEAEIMALGAGIIMGDADTMTAVAAKHGISKQALSKRVVVYVEENKLPPSAFMRSEKDRKTYALTNQPRAAG